MEGTPLGSAGSTRIRLRWCYLVTQCLPPVTCTQREKVTSGTASASKSSDSAPEAVSYPDALDHTAVCKTVELAFSEYRELSLPTH